MNQYTLPQVWDGVKGQVDYAAKQKEVEEFNKSHAWLKRGVAVTPTRSPTLHHIVLLRVFLHHARVFPNSNLTMVFCCFVFYRVLHSVISSAQERASIYFTARN